MTLTGQISKQEFPGIGGTAYDLVTGFIFWDTSDLLVYRRSADYPVTADVLLTEIADYTVDGGNGENGTINAVATYSDGFVLVIRRVPRVQDYDMVQGDGFATNSVETQMDQMTAMIQEVDEALNQVMRLVPEDFSEANLELAAVNDKADRAGLFLRFNDDGDLEATGVVGDIGSYLVTWLNTALAIVQRDLNGDFAARIINAVTFIGNLTGNVTGNLIGSATKVGALTPVEVNIGDWDMVTNPTVTVVHGLADFTKVRGVDVFIRNDTVSALPILTDQAPVGAPGASTTPQGSIGAVGATTVDLFRLTGGNFDDVAFDSTSFNRGWLLFWVTD